MIFEENIGHSPSCAKLFMDPNPNFSLNVAYKLGTGPQKMLTVTIQGANKNLYLKTH